MNKKNKWAKLGRKIQEEAKREEARDKYWEQWSKDHLSTDIRSTYDQLLGIFPQLKESTNES